MLISPFYIKNTTQLEKCGENHITAGPPIMSILTSSFMQSRCLSFALYPHAGTCLSAELTEVQKENPNYTFVGTMTHMEKSLRPWHGETGHIDKGMLAKYIGDLTSPVYYMVGPRQWLMPCEMC